MGRGVTDADDGRDDGPMQRPSVTACSGRWPPVCLSVRLSALSSAYIQNGASLMQQQQAASMSWLILYVNLMNLDACLHRPWLHAPLATPMLTDWPPSWFSHAFLLTMHGWLPMSQESRGGLGANEFYSVLHISA